MLQVNKFVEYLTEGQPTAPSYFSHDVQANMVSNHKLTIKSAPFSGQKFSGFPQI